MLSAIKTALMEASGAKEKPLGKNAQNMIHRRQYVMDHLKTHEYIQNSDVCDGFDVASATATRLLSEMCREGSLNKAREGKYWVYKLAEMSK